MTALLAWVVLASLPLQSDIEGKWESYATPFITLEFKRINGNSYEVAADSLWCFDRTIDWFNATKASGLIVLDKPIGDEAVSCTNVLNVVNLPQGVFWSSRTS